MDEAKAPPDNFAPDGSSETGNNAQDRSSLTKIIGKAIGLDITTIAIPVTYNEPTSFLQRMMEFVQYWDLLDKADKVVESNPEIALLFVTAFAISNFAPTERTTKPFNPLLGETFEYTHPSGLRFVAEQCSHHPPIGASHMENDHFVVEQFHHVKTKFLGNSLEINPTGRTHVTLKSTGTRYTFDGVWTTVHNLIIGRMWVDHYGDTVIQEVDSARRVELKFKPCGWFSKGWHEVEGKLYDDKTALYSIAGLWNQNLYATDMAGHSGKKPKSAAKMLKKHAKKEKKAAKKEEKAAKKEEKRKGSPTPRGDESDDESEDDDELTFDEGKPVLLWQNTVKESTQEPYKKWGLSEFTVELLKITPELQDKLPQSDSRLRPDRIALENLDYSLAGKEKNTLEEAQRERRRKRDNMSAQHNPKFFKKVTLPDGEEHWQFNTKESYWTRREKGFGLLNHYDPLDRPISKSSSARDVPTEGKGKGKEKGTSKGEVKNE